MFKNKRYLPWVSDSQLEKYREEIDMKTMGILDVSKETGTLILSLQSSEDILPNPNFHYLSCSKVAYRPKKTSVFTFVQKMMCLISFKAPEKLET